MCVDRQTFLYTDASGRRLACARRCGLCWQCRKDMVSDVVGRCLAEQSTSDWSCLVTLTYRDCPEREADGAHRFVTVRHLQAYIRAMRDRNYSVRYMAVGEHGSEKGRAHFHVLLFGMGAAPPYPDCGPEDRFWQSEWPHGHMHCVWSPSGAAMVYACKYLLKPARADTPKRKPWYPSKKPPLGHAFFMALADRMHAMRALPITFEYVPPGADGRRTYHMTGATRRNFIARLCELSGLFPVEYFENANEWVQKSAEKVEKWWVERERAPFTIEELDAAFSRELDRRRGPVRAYVDPYAGLED